LLAIVSSLSCCSRLAALARITLLTVRPLGRRPRVSRCAVLAVAQFTGP
jgi:hypothetical protein